VRGEGGVEEYLWGLGSSGSQERRETKKKGTGMGRRRENKSEVHHVRDKGKGGCDWAQLTILGGGSSIKKKKRGKQGQKNTKRILQKEKNLDLPCERLRVKQPVGMPKGKRD